ncbi:MAG: response regulator [Mesorhizobium sp.]|uniref:DAHL domain-containing protein n=1 Tax=Mesorhizobium sp. TaxID=1871066 RepID=UPI00121F7630|nr:DAHL domain-containing protein [Mesorhizobium sp.]TIP30856.1 MAG: response regulator [Mesorhizobium sp.]
MKSLPILAPVVACLLIVLTYLLLQGAALDAARHERTLDAIRTVILYNAALQRDVLRARAGLLRSYDPLVRSIENLNEATQTLPAARDIASGEARADIERRIAEVIAAVCDEETLVEGFKSDNALLQNSLNYFNYMSGRLTSEGDGLRAVEIGALMIAMSRFISDPQPEAARPVTASLDRLARPFVDAVSASDVRSLVSHGRLIVTRLPAVDDLVSRLQAAPTSERARALQDLYLDVHGRAAARAARFQTLLYVAALVLVGYVAYLFARLRHNARILRERLEFEGFIASISTQFINLPRDRIRAGISKGLARLVEHAGLDGAQIFVSRTYDADLSGGYFYRRPSGRSTARLPNDLIELASRWTLADHERQGCIDALSHGNLPAGHYIRLAVRDTGSGMDQATLERIFEPFFTTKPAGHGTGLGLSTVHGIVAAHRGAVDVRSQLGQGTTFEIYFPQIEPASAQADEGEGEATEVPVEYGNGETILVVDDDTPLMQLAEEMLAALGYEPVGFDRSPAALNAFRADPGRFDLVLTDEVMPDMTGVELSGKLHEIRSDLPLVLMTGYGRTLRSPQLTAAGISEVINKPLLSASVAQCLARHLHSG